MSKAGKLVKDLVRAKKESVMGKLGDSPFEDPMEPWSAKYQSPVKEELINEEGLLMKYVRSLGFDPKYMKRSELAAYARSNAYKRYKQEHELTTREEVEYIDEARTGLLMSFIKAKGLDPFTMDGNQKAAYARSSEFRAFKARHMRETSGMGERGEDWNEETVKEQVDKTDTVTLDIPLMIRLLEYAREDAKTDMDLHKVVENLINMRSKGVLSMKHYDDIVSIKAMKEEVSPKKNLDELKKIPDNMDADDHITREDLRKWFSKSHPEGDWKRINAKGEVVGPCAREPGEPKPKCMSKEKRAQLSKSERAAAVAAKRKHDPVADRPGKGGKPVNVSNYGKGKLSEASSFAQQAAIAIAMKKAGKKPKNEEDMDEACWDTHKQVGMKKKGGKMVPDCVPKNEEVEHLEEKNKPTNPKLWSRAKALARSKFDVYPSAYANGWASKWYKSKGGGWRSANEEVEQTNEAKKFGYAAISDRYKKITGSSLEDRAKHYANLEAKFKQQLADYRAQNQKDRKNEEVVQEGLGNVEDSPLSATNSVKAMESQQQKNRMKSARIVKSIYKNKLKETLYDWEKDDKPNAKIVMKGGKTMTGKDRDTVEIEPVLRTRPNGVGMNKPSI